MIKKEHKFKLISILLPFVFIGLLEVVLQLANFGNDLSLFVKDDNHPNMLHLNSKVSLRYFIREKNSTTGVRDLFLKRKPDRVKRIFVQGESTAVGFPYFHNGAFPRMLKYQLQHDLPNENLEVINLAMTALNSYALYDFVDEIIDQKPDAVILNFGHNEYYGALGVGSTGTFGSNVSINRIGIVLRKSKIGQLISLALNALTSTNQEIEKDQTLMKRMVKNQEIPLGSKKYKAGLIQFEKNLDDALAKYNEAGIKVYLTNAVSNLKDLKPFISIEDDSLNADYHYQMGQKFYEEGKMDEAKREFLEAKELDALRFRSPKAINSMIEQKALAYENVVFVDVVQLFEENSKDELIGNELILEHVHPNLKGQFLISQALVNSFKKDHFLYDNTSSQQTNLSVNDFPLTGLDSLSGAISNMLLMEGWPFNIPIAPDDGHEKSLEEALAGGLAVHTIDWEPAMGQLITHYLEKKNYMEAIKIGESLILEHPFESQFYEQLVKICMDGKEYEKGVWYAKRATKLKDSFTIHRQLVILLLKLDKPKEALPYIEKLIASNTSVNFVPMKIIVGQIIEAKDSLRTGTGNLKNYKTQISQLYEQIGNHEAAAKYKE